MNNIITATRQETLLNCPRKHYWSFEVGLKPESDANALRFGKAWHNAMEARWQGASYEEALSKAIPEGVQMDELQVATLSGLLAGYYAKYKDAEVVKELHPEVEFHYSLAGSRTFQVGGKIDGLGILRDDRQVLVESKSTSESVEDGSDYWLRLRFNSQVFQYVLAARENGWDVSVVIYDVVRKPAIEPRQIRVLDEQGRKIVLDAAGQRIYKANGEPRESGDTEKGWVLQSRLETPEEFGQRLADDTVARPDFYFARREVPILEQDLVEFATQRLTLSKLILHCRQAEKKLVRREQAWPRNISQWNCNGCAYNSFCLQNISFDTQHPPSGFRVTEANPELTKVAA
jgi:hypothetical protein